MLRAKLGLGKVDAWLSRDLEGETVPNLSLRLYKQLLRLLPAVFSVAPLCLPLRYAPLRLHVEDGWGGGRERRGRERRLLAGDGASLERELRRRRYVEGGARGRQG